MDADSAAAKEALMQQVLDVSCAATTTRRAAPVVQREWLAAKCVVSQYQFARADALHALSMGNNAARGRALLEAQLEGDTVRFAEVVAGPQHLSWKESAAFEGWLADCPCGSHHHLLLSIQVRTYAYAFSSRCHMMWCCSFRWFSCSVMLSNADTITSWQLGALHKSEE